MCGIIGFWNKDGDAEVPLGATLLKMLEALACRGPDSAGVAMFGSPSTNQFVARVKIGENGAAPERASQIAADADAFGGSDYRRNGAYLRFAIRETGDLQPFLSKI